MRSTSLLMSINLRVFMSIISREMVLFVAATKALFISFEEVLTLLPNPVKIRCALFFGLLKSHTEIVREGDQLHIQWLGDSTPVVGGYTTTCTKKIKTKMTQGNRTKQGQTSEKNEHLQFSSKTEKMDYSNLV